MRWDVGWFCCGLLVLHALSTAPAFAQRDLKDIPDPDPEIERKSFIVADGFEMNLFAADPLIHKPIQMNFDPQGRLWIAASETYPQIAPGQKANDKILILEDTDGDGRSDKTTVFADGLLIPTGVEPGDGGAYVAASTELLHLKDTDGDGKADESRVVLSGFGTEDTHHILHTLRWGPDGMLYMNQSVYIHSHIETPHGVRRLNAGGIWQFRPETMKLEVFARGFVNPWGHAFDDYGVSFATDGAGGEGINYVVPGASYVTAFGAERILSGLNPGSPKLCGLEIVSGRHLPDDWQGNMIANDFRGHRVCRYIVSDESSPISPKSGSGPTSSNSEDRLSAKAGYTGAGFTSREMPELIKSNHVAFRPIDVKMGPDGAIYIADWYNPIIQHGEVDFRDPRRDHTHGRIWRVTAKGRPLVPRPKLVGATVPELLEHLKAPEQWTRHNAKRVLKELWQRNEAPALRADIDRSLRIWADSLKRSPGAEHHFLELLWVYQAVDTPMYGLLSRMLEMKDARVRAGAVHAIAQWHHRFAQGSIKPVMLMRFPLEQLALAISDPHPRVRLEAVRALSNSNIPTARATAEEKRAGDKLIYNYNGVANDSGIRSVETAMRAIDNQVDKWLDYALWLTARDLAPHWVPFAEKNEFNFNGNAKHLAFAIKAAGATSAIPALVKLMAERKVAEQDQAEVIQVIASLGGPNELKLVLDVAQDNATSSARRAALLNELAESARRRNVKPAGDLVAMLKPWLEATSDEPTRRAAINCLGKWKVESLRGTAVQLASTNETPLPLRQAALEALTELGGPDSVRTLVAHSDAKEPWPVRLTAVASLASLDLKLAAEKAVEIFSSTSPQNDPTALFNALLQHKGGPEALSAALQDKRLPEDAAKFGVRAIDASGRPIPALSEALIKASGLTSGPRELSPEQMQALVDEVKTKGDPHRGEVVYRRKGLDCLKCHAIGGAGGRVGPDLISLGSSAQVDYIAESLLAPNKKVKENFNSLVVVTDDGKVRSGIKLRQTDTDLLLRDAEDNEIAIPLKKIEEQSNGVSLMPAGLADKLTRTELVDLVRFLSELGKVGDFQISKQQLVRRWQTLMPTEAAIMQLRRVSYASIAQNDSALTWSSAYSNVAGELPLTELPELRIPFRAKEGQLGAGFTRFEIDVTSAGQVKLLWNSTDGLIAWLDTNPIKLERETLLDLSQGRHRLTIAIELSQRKDPLRVELTDAPGSVARATLVGGK
jgi:putative heme-binding domain-containing protein